MRKLNDPFYEPLRSWLEEIQKDLATQEAQIREKMDEQTIAHRTAISELETAHNQFKTQITAENEKLKTENARMAAELMLEKELRKQKIEELQSQFEREFAAQKKSSGDTEIKLNERIQSLESENKLIKAEALENYNQMTAHAKSANALTQEVENLRETIRLNAQEYRAHLNEIESANQKKSASHSIENEKLKAQIYTLTTQINVFANENKKLQTQASEARSQMAAINSDYQKKFMDAEMSAAKRTQLLTAETERLKAEVTALTIQLNTFTKKSAESQNWIDSLMKTNAAKEAEVRKARMAVEELKAYSEKTREEFNRILAKEHQLTAEAEQKSLEQKANALLLEEKLATTERELRVYKNQIRTIGECMKDISEITAKPNEVAHSIETTQTLKALIAEERAVFDRVTQELKDKLNAIEKETTAKVEPQNRRPNALSIEEIERGIRQQRRS